MRRKILTLKEMFKLLGRVDVLFIVSKNKNGIELKKAKKVDLDQHIENCRLISKFLISTIESLDLNVLDMEEHAELRRIEDEHYLYVKTVTRMKGVPEKTIRRLRAASLSIKLGTKISVDWLLDSENAIFSKFITRNYLQHDFSALRLQLPFDFSHGPSIPVYRKSLGLSWIPFKRIKIERDEARDKLVFTFEGKKLFDTALDYVFGDEYACFYQGIREYNIFTDPQWLPYDKRDPSEWGKRYLCQVWTFSKHESKGRPSLFHRTHAYMKLLDKDGHVRSVGQDVLVEARNYKIRELLSHKSGYGKIVTPDRSVLYPTNSRKFWHVEIEITKEEHDKIIAIVEKDKLEKDRSMSVLRKNCVSYVVKLLDEALGLKVNARLNGIHVFFKSLMPDKAYRKFMRHFDPWYNRQKPAVQKAIYFFPPFYLASVLTVLAASIAQSNNYRGNKKDLPFLQSILYPWEISADHPLSLHRNLEKMADENGVILLKRDQLS